MADAPASAPTPGSVTLYDPKTNAPVVVDAADAHALILGGKLNYAPGTRVPVSIKGQVGSVDADELGDAVAKYGAKPVTSEAWHAAEQQEKYGSTGQAILAGAESALDTATLGASNAIIGGLGGQEVREAMRGREEANPTASMVGAGIGLAAPIAADILSGGTLTPELAAAEAARLGERGLLRAGAETAAKAIAAPTRAVAKVGEFAEAGTRALVGSEAKSAAARVAQNILAGGARGVAEGGIYNVGAEVGHQYLQDNPDLAGDALATAWVHGALLGGALGGAVHGVGSLLTKKAPVGLFAGAEGAAETKALAKAGEGAEHAAPGAEPRMADKAADLILAQVPDPKRRAVLKRAWDSGDFGGVAHGEMLQEAERKIAKDLDATLEAGRVVDKASFGEGKRAQMANLVPAENIKPARAALTEIITDAQKTVDELNALHAKGGGAGSVRMVEKWLEDFRDLPKHIWNDPAELFMRADDIKRLFGREAKFGEEVFGGKRTFASRKFEEAYEKIRQALEDESTWGAGAVAQRENNKAATDMIGVSGYFNKKYTVRYDSKAGEPVYRADPGAIKSFLNDITKPSNDLHLEAFRDRIAKRKAWLDSVERNYDFTPEVKKAVATERAALDSMSKTIAKTGEEVAQINQLKAIMAEEKGHGIGGLIGAAVDAVTRPGMSLARLAAAQHYVDKTRAKIEHGVGQIRRALEGKKPAALEPHGGPTTYEKRRASVLDAVGRAEALGAHLQGSAAPFAPRAPAAARTFQQASLRTVSYLMAALPKPKARVGSLTPKVDLEAWEPSDQEKSQFARKYDATMHPEHVPYLLAHNELTPQHVEALRETHPAMYAEMSAKIEAYLSTLNKPVPYSMQAPIKLFLGKPQLDPGIQRIMQSNYAPPAQAQQNTQQASAGLRRPLKLDDTTSLNGSSSKERL